MALFACEDVWRLPDLLTGDVFDPSRGFFADRLPFFFDKVIVPEESVAASLGGDEGGVASVEVFWVEGVVILFGLRRAFRGPLGVIGVGDWADIATGWLNK